MLARRSTIVVAFLAVVFISVLAPPPSLPATASGSPTTPTASATPPFTRSATASSALDWRIGSPAKSGCPQCHYNSNILMAVDGQTLRTYATMLSMSRSAHANHQCVDCHPGFTNETPHSAATQNDEWRRIARSSCRECHGRQYEDWMKSDHFRGDSREASVVAGARDSSAPGMPRPLCGDCHQSHSIPARYNAAGRVAERARILSLCKRCHKQAAASYDDYYHGAAYRTGAPDAPVCWQCHSMHLVLPATSPESMTNPANLAGTCAACHKNANWGYVQYAPMIHSQHALYERNPIVSAVGTATTTIRDAFRGVLSTFQTGKPQ